MNGRIEWDVAADPLRACLMVEVKERGILRPATLDDLKRSCEAVGLHVVDRGVFDAIVAKGEANRVRAEKADGELSEVCGLIGGDTAIEGAVAACRSLNELVDQKRVLARDLADRTRESIGYQSANENMHETIATLRAQLAELSAEHRSMVAASLRELEVLRGQLAAAAADQSEAENAAIKSQLAALTSPEGRATDEELIRVYCDQWKPSLIGGGNVDAGVVAVAARVRRERGECLVERLVAAKAKFSAFEDDRTATWTIRVCLPGTGGYTTNVTDLPAADVPATLARLAGLDGGT